MLDGGDGVDRVLHANAPGPVLVDLGAGRSGDDTLIGIEGAGSSAFGDTLLGSEGDDRLGGIEGDDLIDGGPGNDTILVGAGADLIAGGPGIDTFSFRDSPEPIRINFLLPGEVPTPGVSSFYQEIEIFIGSAFADTIVGIEAPDHIEGRGGDDRLDGNAGDDVLVGGSGADAIEGGDGLDIASYADAPGSVILALLFGLGFAGNAAGDSLQGIEGAEGSAFADVIAGSAAGDALAGLGGEDRLFGLDGGDLLLGGEGGDVVVGDAGDDILGGDAGDDLLIGGAGADAIEGGAGNDRIECDAADLTVRGGDGGDAFDLLVLGASASGWDIDLGRDDNQNVGVDGPAIAGFRAVDALGSTVPVGIQGAARDGLGNVIFGSGFADSIRGSEAADILLGGPNEPGDYLTAGLIDAAADYIDAGAGNDSVYSDSGLDRVTLGAGQDLIVIGTLATGAAWVSDFTVADDTIGLPASLGMSAAQALAALQATAEGTALILPTGGRLDLVGIAPGALGLDSFDVLPI